ncbi:hypothetical protein [Streptomyces sp. S1]|uniref:hypothetical protein n=1 Tax=Streptomyces sp. S1 TaxID=718288 RepID=UPI003D737718
MDFELTDDEYLKALAALEAIVKGRDDELSALADDPGERPLPVLLARYGRATLTSILSVAFGLDAALSALRGPGELMKEIEADPTGRMVFILTESLHNQAVRAGSDPVVTKEIGQAVLAAIHAFTAAENDEALALLGALRDDFLSAE